MGGQRGVVNLIPTVSESDGMLVFCLLTWAVGSIFLVFLAVKTVGATQGSSQ